MKTLILNVSGMHCDDCVTSLTQSLQRLAGVRGVKVDLLSRTVEVRHEDQGCNPRDLVSAIQRAGFQVDGFRSPNAA